MTVECKPEGGASWDEERLPGGAKDQLRCRFTKNGTSVEVPVLPGEDNALLCLCQSQVDMTVILLLLCTFSHRFVYRAALPHR